MMTRVRLHTLGLAAVALAAACTQDRTMSEVTVTPLGAAGGLARSPDGLLELAVPASALTQDTDVSIAIDRSTLDGTLASPVYVIGPQDLAFARDVELRIRVRALPTEDELDIADLGTETASLLDALLDDASATLTTSIRRASSYAARHRPNRCAGLACGADCTTGPIARACNSVGRCVPTFVPLGCGVGGDGGVIPDAQPIPSQDGGVDGGPAPIDAGPGPLDAGPGPIDAGPGPMDGGPSPAIVFEQEPNNTLALENVVSPDVTVQADLSPGGDVDYFGFDIVSDGIVTAYTYTAPGSPSVCVGVDTVIDLLDGSGTVIASNDDFGGGIGCSRVSVPVAGPGHYTVRVRHFNTASGTGAYLLDILFQATSGGFDGGGVFDAGGPFDGSIGADGGSFFDASSPGDAANIPPDATTPADGGVATPDAGAIVNGTETEPNDSPATGNLVAPVSTVLATLAPAGDQDYFIVDVPGNATLTAYTYTQANVPTACVGIDTILELYAAGGLAPLASNDDQASQNRCSRVQATVGPGLYHLRVRNFAGIASSTPYYLDVIVQ